MELIEGPYLSDLINGLTTSDAGVLRGIFRSLVGQARRLDLAGLDHGELVRLRRHTMMRGLEPVIIDFESASTSRRVANVTTVVQSLFLNTKASLVVERIMGLPDRERLEVRDQDGALVVGGLRGSFVLHRSSSPEACAITALYPLFDAAVALDEDHGQAAQDAVALMIGLLAPEHVAGDACRDRSTMLRKVAVRSLAIRNFIASHSLGLPGLDHRFSTLLRRAEGAAMAAAHGDQGAFSRMLKALDPLFAWTTRRATNRLDALLQPW